MRRKLIFKLPLSLAIGLITSALCEGESGRPNVLFIAIDDLRNFVNAFGYEQVHTPNLDRIAMRSTRFTNAHTQAPMCGPSRASVMTGRMPYNTGVYGFADWRIAPALSDAVTLNQHFTQQGYHTMSGGKIYHSNQSRPGEWTEVYSKSLHKTGTWGEEAIQEEDRAVRSYHGLKPCGPVDLPDEVFHDAMTAEMAVERLRREYAEPWFLAVGFTKPHLSWIAPRKYFDLYNPDELILPEVLADDVSDTPDAAQYPSNNVHSWGIDAEEGAARRLLHAYLATISFVDAQIGKVLDALDERSDSDNTVIVVWSDHGWHLGEKQCWTKFTLWAESTRSPLMISRAGQTEATQCAQPVQLIDIYPTLVELCGLALPESELDGRSLVPLLDNSEMEWPWPALSCNGRDSYALTFQRWKYMRFFDGSEELYDQDADPLEHHNLAGLSDHAETKTRLARYLPEFSHPNISDGKEWAHWLSDYPDLDEWRREMREMRQGFAETGKVPLKIFRKYTRAAAGR